MSILSWLFGSGAKRSLSASDLPEVVEMIEEGFADLAFGLMSYRRLEDGSQVLDVRGRRKGREVGFRVRLSSAWEKRMLGDTGIVAYQAVVYLESIGKPSDQFVDDLADLYGGLPQPGKMASSVVFTAISLEGLPAQLDRGPVKIKLFFEPDDESEKAYEQFYAEYYLNIDVTAKLVEFGEKDPDYRKAMLRALSEDSQRLPGRSEQE